MANKRFVDLHCDTVVCEVMKSRGVRRLRSNPEGHLDLVRLGEAGSLVQAFALFISKDPAGSGYTDENIGPWEFFNRAADWYDRELADNADLLAPVLQYGDIAGIAAAGKIGALLTVEDGVPMEGSLARLDDMHRRGVRLITLTWNYENSLAFPNAVAPEKGLKPFGFAALERMNELGVVPDVSHLSDAGFWDVAKHTKKPFVASHSNARALCPVMRNLTDEMLRALAEKGGVAGLNFASDFLVANTHQSYIKDIVRHARHIAHVAGVETLALGSDFDGIDCALEFRDCTGLPLIEEALNAAFPAREVDLITNGNALRVLRESIG
ncbi:MAG TPA: dipeptidase [Clostridia bacterium]|nr:dipeptidase [Clostridia bacterium]